MPRRAVRPESQAYIRRVLAYIDENPGRTTRQIAASLGTDKRRVSAVLAEHARREAGRHTSGHYWYPKVTETAPIGVPNLPPQGPSGELHSNPTPQIAQGLELKAQTIKVRSDGSLDHRYDKSHTARKGVPFESVPDLWQAKKLTTRVEADGRAAHQYITAVPEELDRWNLMIDAARAMCEEFRGAAGVTHIAPGYELQPARIMNVFALGDPHIGALADADETGTDNDLKIAERDNDMFLDHMVEIAPLANTGYLLLAGDNSHADDDQQRTPGHGHKVDVDSRAHKIFRTGVRLWTRAVQRILRTHARVVVDIRRGNHDPITAFFLAETIRAAFALDPRVKVLDNVKEHNYFLFFNFLLATTHGHKTKPEGLAEVMLADVPDLALQATAGRHWILGHVHSKNWWDFRTCTVETLRTIFPGDAWANGAGYRSFRGSVVITIDGEVGEIMRQSISLARARLAKQLREASAAASTYAYPERRPSPTACICSRPYGNEHEHGCPAGAKP